MVEYVVYVLFSLKSGKRYVGFTSDLINRFRSHNYFGKKGWTIKHRPWRVIRLEFYADKNEASDREKSLKSGQGRAWIDENLNKEI